jgi:hypothetical protein
MIKPPSVRNKVQAAHHLSDPNDAANGRYNGYSMLLFSPASCISISAAFRHQAVSA